MAVTTSLSESNFSRYISILTKPSLFTAVQYLFRRSAKESVLFTLLFAINSLKYCVIDFDVLGNYFSSTYFKSLHSMMFNDFISIDCFYQRSDAQQLLVLYELMRAHISSYYLLITNSIIRLNRRSTSVYYIGLF